MSSATGIPEENPAVNHRSAEDEPLLGRRGDASQQDGQGIQFNLVLGTAIIAQAGIWILTATIYASVFIHPLIPFTPHPLLNITALLLSTQAILLLQPTHTPHQKHLGTHIHATLNSLSILFLLAALIIIEYTKISHGGTHFVSPHAILGLITYILFGVQAVVGVTQFYAPGVYGGVERAKRVYKWHRWSGYGILVLALATVCAATQTDYNKGTLHVRLWAVVVASVITLVGVLPRVRKGKLGL